MSLVDELRRGMTAEELAASLSVSTIPVAVYVSGPYSGDPEGNTREAIRVATVLGDAGFMVFLPHLTHFWHTQCPRPYEFWLRQDLYWVKKCAIIVRLYGVSDGANREVKKGIMLEKLILYWHNNKLWLNEKVS